MKDGSGLLTYKEAREIYLEIYSHSKVVARYVELGLKENKAESLARQISEDITNYELAKETYKRDLLVGAILAAIGIASLFFVDEQAVKQLILLGKLKWALVPGVGMLFSWFRKNKVVKKYESE